MAVTPTPIDPNELNEARKLAASLGEDFAKIEDQINKGNMSLAQFNTYLIGLRAQARSFNNELDYSVKSYTQILSQLGKQNIGLKLANSSISSLSDIARKVLSSQQGLVDLSIKEINALKSKTEQKINDLRLSLEIAKSENATQDTLNQINQAIKDSTQAHGDLLESIDRETNRLEKQNEILGLTGTSIKGLSTLFDKLGLGALGNVLGLDDALKNAQEKARELSFDMTDVGKKKLNSEIQDLKTQLTESKDNINDLTSAMTNAGKVKLNNEINTLNNDLTQSNKDIAKYTQYLNQSKDPAKIAKWQQAINDENSKIININKQLDKKNSYLKDAPALLNQEKIKQDNINKQLDEKNKRFNLVNQNGSLFNAKLNILKGSIGDIGTSLIKNLKDPLFLVTFFVTQMIDALKSSDKATGDLAKGFNITYNEASNLRQELNTIANSSGDIAVTTKGLQESMMAVGSALGTNVMLNEKDLTTMTQLAEKAGISREEQMGMLKLSLATGKSLESNVGEFMAQAKIQAQNNGIIVNEKQLLKEVNNLSNAIKLSVGGTGGELGKAVAAAKALGMNLEQVDKIAGSLLEFESSISAELEAELLTGKQLNLEKARYYALTNNAAGLAEELAKNVGTAAEFGKMNRIQQEAYAKSLGMSREEIAASLVEREALRNMTKDEAAEASSAFRARVEAVGLEKAQKELAEGKIKDMMHQQSMQERFNQSVEKLKEIFVTVADAIMPILNIFAGILDIVGLIFKPLGAIMGWAQSIGGPLKTIMGILIGIGAAALLMAGSLTFGIGVAVILAAVGGGMAIFEAQKAKAQKANDMISPGYGKRTILSPEGSISLNDKDTIIAGTNLGGNTLPALPQPKEKITNVNDNNQTIISGAFTDLISKISSLISKISSALPQPKEKIINVNDNNTTITPEIASSSSQPKDLSANIPVDLSPLLAEIRLLKEAINSRPIMVETKIELDGQQISYNQSTGTNSFRS